MAQTIEAPHTNGHVTAAAIAIVEGALDEQPKTTTESAAYTATRTVAIVGTASTSRDLALELPTEVEVWGLNSSYSWMNRWDRWFEIHDPNLYQHFTKEHLSALQEMNVPIYMIDHRDDIPNSVRYPIEAVTEDGQLRQTELTSSIAYMLALAVHECFSEIRLIGIDMAVDSEYAYQRPACEYWIGVAEARGIKVVIPDTSPIGKGFRYGRDPQSLDMVREMRDQRDKLLDQRRNLAGDFFRKLKEDLESALAEDNAIEGALQVANHFIHQKGQ